MSIIQLEKEKTRYFPDSYDKAVRVNELNEALTIYERLTRGEVVVVSVNGDDFSKTENVHEISSLEELAQCALIHPGLLVVSDKEVAFIDWW